MEHAAVTIADLSRSYSALGGSTDEGHLAAMIDLTEPMPVQDYDIVATILNGIFERMGLGNPIDLVGYSTRS